MHTASNFFNRTAQLIVSKAPNKPQLNSILSIDWLIDSVTEINKYRLGLSGFVL